MVCYFQRKVALIKHWWWGADSNCRTLRERIYSPPRLATSLPHQNYINTSKDLLKWWLRTESNRRHKDFQSFALPTELLSHIIPLVLINTKV